MISDDFLFGEDIEADRGVLKKLMHAEKRAGPKVKKP